MVPYTAEEQCQLSSQHDTGHFCPFHSCHISGLRRMFPTRWSISGSCRSHGGTREQTDPRKATTLKAEALAGWPLHPCYVFGNEHCLCALCLVYGSLGDLRMGARHNPQVYRLYRDWEEETGITFRKGGSLRDVVEGNVPGSLSCAGCCGCTA